MLQESNTPSNLVNVRTMLIELDRYLPVLMRLFVDGVPEGKRHVQPELSPPWSSPIKPTRRLTIDER